MHANRMRSIILSSVASPALKYFSTLSHKRRDFRGGEGGIIEHKLHDLILSTTFARNISHSMKNPARYCNECTSVFLYIRLRYVTLRYVTCYSCQISIEV